MKQLLSLTIFAILFSSCFQNKPKMQQPENVPEALQENKTYTSLTSKRYAGNLVEELYEEVLKQNTTLKNFEQTVNQLPRQKADSLSYYFSFSSKNDGYYSAAENYLSSIQDSALKKRMQQLLTESKSTFETNTASLKNIEQQITLKEKQLTELKQAIKIMVTLPLIEKYQQKNKPGENPLKVIYKKYETATLKADSILKK